jgi:hypothetical protein
MPISSGLPARNEFVGIKQVQPPGKREATRGETASQMFITHINRFRSTMSASAPAG